MEEKIFALEAAFPLSSPSAHSEIFIIETPPPTKKMDKVTPHLWVSRRRTQRKDAKGSLYTPLYTVGLKPDQDILLCSPDPTSGMLFLGLQQCWNIENEIR